MSQSSSKLSLTSRASQSFTKQNNPVVRFLLFENYCFHLKTRGKLTFDLEKSKLKFSVRGEMSEKFKKNYHNKKEFEILKSNIEDVKSTEGKEENGKENYLFRIGIKNIDENGSVTREGKIFVFQQEPNKNNKQVRDRFVTLIEGMKSDYMDIYKSDFKKLSLQTQKKISFFMKNKDLLILYKKLSKVFDSEKIFKYIIGMHPERINISLGNNRIQLSRDDELKISEQLSNKNFNVNKLISSDINIYKQYYDALSKDEFKPEEFWIKFYNNQKDNKTYLIGDYNPIELNKKNNNDVTDNNLMEELEKDKYYYDNYETNYLYYENEYDQKSKINNYSINKMKEINYFSYSPQNINLYILIKNQIKNKQPKKNIVQATNPNQNSLAQMEIEKGANENKINKPKRISKSELYDKILKMKKEYKENKNTNNNKTTIKAITEEVDKVYNLANIMNALNNSADGLNDIYKNILIIKDLSLIYKREHNTYESYKERLNPDKKKEKSFQLQQIQNEMNNIIAQIKKKEGQYEQKPLINFLIKYAEYNSAN